MAPIRIAIIGLSTTAKTSWAAGGHLPYLNSARGKERYQITALLNSSVDAAKRAIAGYDLGPDVKPYGSPQDLAADADIDLCATRVDVHYDTIKPSIAAGKAVFVEWPLAENVQRASELADLAKEKHVDTIVGVQGRVAPPIVKVKELLHAGTIGKVLSSELYLAAPFVERGRVSEGLGYFLDKKVGGNPVSIGFAHSTYYLVDASLTERKLIRNRSNRLCSSHSRRIQEILVAHPDPATAAHHLQQRSRHRALSHF